MLGFSRDFVVILLGFGLYLVGFFLEIGWGLVGICVESLLKFGWDLVRVLLGCVMRFSCVLDVI